MRGAPRLGFAKEVPTLLGEAAAVARRFDKLDDSRLAVRVEDTRSRRTLGEAVETGSEQELFGLVARVGERLRDLLGEGGGKPVGVALDG